MRYRNCEFDIVSANGVGNVCSSFYDTPFHTQQKQQFHLKKPEEFRYCNQNNTHIDGVRFELFFCFFFFNIVFNRLTVSFNTNRLMMHLIFTKLRLL